MAKLSKLLKIVKKTTVKILHRISTFPKEIINGISIAQAYLECEITDASISLQ